MPNCSFCDVEIEKGKGILFAKKDGTVLYFCSGKCRKNALKLKREGRRQNWTIASRKFKEQTRKKKKK